MCSLVNHLVKRMLAICAWLAEIDLASFIMDSLAIERDLLAIALHRELLEIGRKTFEVLFVGQHGNGFRSEEIVVPNR